MKNDTKIFGFWVYLMTDLVIFAVLFACFHCFARKYFRWTFWPASFFIYPLCLPKHSYCSRAVLLVPLACLRFIGNKRTWAIIWFIVTFLLGVSFLYIEISEFSEFVDEGASWQRSAFLSSFFTLVGTHGLHISVGLLWMIVAMSRLCFRELSPPDTSRIFRLAFFWHFLDVVWIFIFTVVYGLAKL